MAQATAFRPELAAVTFPARIARDQRTIVGCVLDIGGHPGEDPGIVLSRKIDGHTAFYNSRALEMADVKLDEP